ncbi:MAG: hypothetical protein KTR14_01545, partial [Vampirovibrio sp.]|nr:hypothetical protein [Vampirovibrio sp.]
GISFLRNYITTKRTGTTDYAQMIGEKDRQNMDPNYVQEVAEGNLKHYLKAAGAGALLSATIMLSTIAIAKKGIAMPKILRWIQSKTSLLEGKFSKAPIPAIILFGVLPAYAGFIDGARDIYEKKEIALRFAGYITSFHLLPKLIENAIGKGLKPRKITRVLGGPQNLAYVGKFLSTLIFSSSMPAILNIYLTRQRVKRDIAKSNLSPLFGDSSTYHPLKRHPILFTRQPLPIY